MRFNPNAKISGYYKAPHNLLHQRIFGYSWNPPINRFFPSHPTVSRWHPADYSHGSFLPSFQEIYCRLSCRPPKVTRRTGARVGCFLCLLKLCMIWSQICWAKRMTCSGNTWSPKQGVLSHHNPPPHTHTLSSAITLQTALLSLLVTHFPLQNVKKSSALWLKVYKECSPGILLFFRLQNPQEKWYNIWNDWNKSESTQLLITHPSGAACSLIGWITWQQYNRQVCCTLTHH